MSIDNESEATNEVVDTMIMMMMLRNEDWDGDVILIDLNGIAHETYIAGKVWVYMLFQGKVGSTDPLLPSPSNHKLKTTLFNFYESKTENGTNAKRVYYFMSYAWL